MTDALPFTGERFTPECVREIWYEHWHRYAFALPLARGKRVLDAACGEGYGSALLAGSATSVLGVDLAPTAIEHARTRYAAQANLRFEAGDVTALDALPAASFDLIVSLETLEHVHAQEAMIAGFERLLAPGGLLLLSSPDKRTYSDATGFRNEHHVRELYREQLLDLLQPHFPAVRLYGQKLLFASAIWSLDQAPTTAAACTAGASPQELTAGLAYDPLYFIALCARESRDLPDAARGLLSLFGDAAQSVYGHYQHEIRKNIAAGGVLADLEARLALAEARALAAEARAAAPVDDADNAPRGGLWARLFDHRNR